LEASGYWWPGAKCLVERLFDSVRAPKRCRGVSTELTHLNHWSLSHQTNSPLIHWECWSRNQNSVRFS